MPALHPQPFKVNKAASHSREPGVLNTDICEILLGTKPRRHLYRLIAEVKPTVHFDTGWQSLASEAVLEAKFMEIYLTIWLLFKQIWLCFIYSQESNVFFSNVLQTFKNSI